MLHLMTCWLSGAGAAGAATPERWARLWPADDGSMLVARAGPASAPALWLWEAGASPEACPLPLLAIL